MYTGHTERACALCGDPDVTRRLDLPPRAVTLMRNAEPIAWRDIVGTVSIHFCADDWATVRDLVVDLGMHPLSRCNAARASLTLRDDYEAYVTETRPRPDQTDVEERLLAEAAATLDARNDPATEERDVVEALVVRRALAECGVTRSTS